MEVTLDKNISGAAPINPHLREFHCSFEEEPICMFTQDKNDDFDWTRHSAATRDTKYTPNTGPSTDHTGSKQGFYMYIETSRPRKEGDQARLVSPFFNIAPKNPYGITNPPAYCFGFFYHMYGKHIDSGATEGALCCSLVTLFTGDPISRPQALLLSEYMLFVVFVHLGVVDKTSSATLKQTQFEGYLW
ncbi:MAM domain-containing glycosylphosphatidylinositol anchor protein 2 [Characodon lateralis]|uniref:MAM domain-containing glycosylphosphatidylinositol anchor protein 2 n=1 Tax=Characodon lateralis TaxID=208331 RepID=A0ABU7CWP9_9TELE|nr:MAM domain-containing glycosylphosphatidylinositol anchor protein 2 [Characodon lateralis]